MGWWTWGPVTGALIRRVQAEVINVSAGGCLLQTAAPLAPGLVGVLKLDAFDSATDAVRICHGLNRPGSALPYCAGAEFLVFDTASATSIRDRVATVQGPRAAKRLATAGENSGMGHTTPKRHDRWPCGGGAATSSDRREM